MFLNPFTAIQIRKDQSENTYVFVSNTGAAPVTCTFTSRQITVLNRMIKGEDVSSNEISSVFPPALVKTFMEYRIFVPEKADMNSLASRTEGFLEMLSLPDAMDELREKKILILGAGGIGSWVALMLARHGVGRIDIVDMDEVEESNLNRQAYDLSDIGKEKVSALKEKAFRINPDTAVYAITQKIDSEECLEQIVSAVRYDLIIKAVDSPADFPVWLDSVASRYQLPYIAGITMRDNILVGPMYIPGRSDIGWTDIFPTAGDAPEKIYGTAPSLGFMLMQMAAEITAESIKYLIGAGELKYNGRIVIYNPFTAVTKTVEGKRKEIPSSLCLIVELVLMTVITILASKSNHFLSAGILWCCLLPMIFEPSDNRKQLQVVFLNSIVVCTVFFINVLARNTWQLSFGVMFIQMLLCSCVILLSLCLNAAAGVIINWIK